MTTKCWVSSDRVIVIILKSCKKSSWCFKGLDSRFRGTTVISRVPIVFVELPAKVLLHNDQQHLVVYQQQLQNYKRGSKPLLSSGINKSIYYASGRWKMQDAIGYKTFCARLHIYHIYVITSCSTFSKAVPAPFAFLYVLSVLMSDIMLQVTSFLSST